MTLKIFEYTLIIARTLGQFWAKAFPYNNKIKIKGPPEIIFRVDLFVRLYFKCYSFAKSE